MNNTPPSYSSRIVFNSSDEQVSRLIELGETAPPQGSDAELAALSQQQMEAVLAPELARLRFADKESVAADSFAEAARSGMTTFGELFQTPSPPLKVLELAKTLFKRRVDKSPEKSAPRQLYYFFYILSIVVARVRAQTNISKLTLDQQLRAVNSILKLPWVDEKMREVLTEGRNQIAAEIQRGT